MTLFRRGFTLIELVIALTLVGVVALLVYGAANAALDTQSRIEERQLAVRAERAWLALVEDALRNARPGAAYGAPVFIVEQNSDPEGRPRDRLKFITAGGTPPLTADADWEVTIEPTDAGLTMVAAPVGVDAPPRLLVGLPGKTGLDVRVHGASMEAEWLEDWRLDRLVPRAIELTYWTDSGPSGPPVLLNLPLGMVQGG